MLKLLEESTKKGTQTLDMSGMYKIQIKSETLLIHTVEC